MSTQVAVPDVWLHRVVEGGSQADAPTTWLDGARRRGGLAHPHPISLPRRRFGHAVVALGGRVGGAGAGVGLDSRQTDLWCARLRSHHGACSQRSGGLECALSRDPAPGPRTGSAAHASAASFSRCEVRSRCRAQWRSRGGGSARLATDGAGDRGTVGQLSLQGNQVHWSMDGSRTPMAILDDLESTGEGLHLWDEITAAVSADQAHAGDHLHAHRLPAPKIAHYFLGK